MSARQHALVLGGTGAVGSRVVARLRERGIATTFAWHRSHAKAEALAATGATPVQVDLASATGIDDLFASLDARGVLCDVLVHCAAVHGDAATPEAFDRAVAVSGRAAMFATQAFAKRLEATKTPGHVVLVGALDRAQSLPLPPLFAAAQGMLGPLAMSLAKALGPQGIRVNLVAAGLLDQGISASLDPALVDDYRKFSALRRVGTPDEVAAPIVFLALENEGMTGKVFAANGGVG